MLIMVVFSLRRHIVVCFLIHHPYSVWFYSTTSALYEHLQLCFSLSSLGQKINTQTRRSVDGAGYGNIKEDNCPYVTEQRK